MYFSNPLADKINVKQHGERIAQKNLYPFLVASKIENLGVAGIYNHVDGRYELESANGIGMTVLSENAGDEISVFMINSVKVKREIHKKITSDQDFNNLISQIKQGFSYLLTRSHKKVKQNEALVLKSIVKERILKKDFNFDDFVTIEQNHAYSQAFFELIETCHIYELEYFSKKRKIDFSQMPKDRLIDPLRFCDLTNVSIRKTTVKDTDIVLANRASRISSDKFSEMASWSKYDADRKVQICCDHLVMAEFPIDAGEDSFYINSKKERVSDILNNIVIDKHAKAFKPRSNVVTSISGKVAALNNLVTILSRGAFVSKYVSCGSGIDGGVLIPLEFDGHFCMIDAKSSYYAFREALYFIEKGETFELTLYEDRLIIETSHGKKIVLRSFLITEKEACDVQFMHDNFSMYEPVNVIHILFQYSYFESIEEERPEIRKVRVLSKIEDYISRHKDIESQDDYLNDTPMTTTTGRGNHPQQMDMF